MATNENEIGVRARFIMEDFDRHVQQYNAKLAQANQATDTFYKEQTKARKRRQPAASKASADQQAKSINQVVSGFRNASIVIAGITAGIVLGYKKLSDAAIEFGDTEAIAEFDALSASVNALEDSLLAAGLEFNKTLDIVRFFADRIDTVRQIVALTVGSLVYLGSVAGRLPELLKAAAAGGDAFKKKLVEIDATARASANAALLGVVTAPERSLATSQAADREKEAQKAREKNAEQLADYIDKIRDLQIKSGESLLDAEKDYQDKSASAWQDYISKVPTSLPMESRNALN